MSKTRTYFVRGGYADLLERVLHGILSYHGMIWSCLVTFEKQDGYSDDDSFVTSDEEDDDDADDEEEVPVPDPNAPSLDPITTDELLANFGPPEEPSGPA